MLVPASDRGGCTLFCPLCPLGGFAPLSLELPACWWSAHRFGVSNGNVQPVTPVLGAGLVSHAKEDGDGVPCHLGGAGVINGCQFLPVQDVAQMADQLEAVSNLFSPLMLSARSGWQSAKTLASVGEDAQGVVLIRPAEDVLIVCSGV